MSVPADLDLADLANEAWNKAGVLNPTDEMNGRVEDNFLEEIKNDIWQTAFNDGNTQLKTLQDTVYRRGALGSRSIAMPDAVEEIEGITLFTGTHYDTLQAGSASSATLAAAEDLTEDEALGAQLFIYGGTGPYQVRQIITYDTTTKVVQQDFDWTTTPDNTSTYLVLDEGPFTVDKEGITDIDAVDPFTLGRPSTFTRHDRRILFNRPFDTAYYAIQIRYYMNINQIDRDDDRMIRIYRNWRSTIIAGLTWKCMEDQDDTRTNQKMGEYKAAVKALLIRETTAAGEFEGFTI